MGSGKSRDYKSPKRTRRQAGGRWRLISEGEGDGRAIAESDGSATAVGQGLEEGRGTAYVEGAPTCKECSGVGGC